MDNPQITALTDEFVTLMKSHPDYGSVGYTVHWHDGQVVRTEITQTASHKPVKLEKK